MEDCHINALYLNIKREINVYQQNERSFMGIKLSEPWVSEDNVKFYLQYGNETFITSLSHNQFVLSHFAGDQYINETKTFNLHNKMSFSSLMVFIYQFLINFDCNAIGKRQYPQMTIESGFKTKAKKLTNSLKPDTHIKILINAQSVNSY